MTKITEYHVIIPLAPNDHRDGFYPNLNDVTAAIQDLLADDDIHSFIVTKLVITELDGTELE